MRRWWQEWLPSHVARAPATIYSKLLAAFLSLARTRPRGGEGCRAGCRCRGKDEAQGAEQHGARGGFRDEAERSQLERARDIVAIVEGPEHDDRDRGMALTQFREHGEAVAVREIQVEQYEVEMGLAAEEYTSGPMRRIPIR